MSVLRRIVLPMSCLGVWCWLVATPHDLASDAVARPALTPVPVESGIATFDLTAASDRDQYLILVSSLSPQAGPFAVEISTMSVAEPNPLPPPIGPIGSAARLDSRERRQPSSVRSATEPPRPAADAVPPAERTFWLMVRGDDLTNRQNYEAVHARCCAIAQHCAVYGDVADAIEPKSPLVQDVVDTFDREVYPSARKTLGSHLDVDGDGRFTILFTRRLGRLANGTISVGGFVRGSDFYDDLPPPFGNRCDMMYLNAAARPGPHLRTLIAHEYTHAITFSEHVFGRYVPDRVPREEESWLDEAIAHIVENQHGYAWSNLDYRVSGFLNAPERYRLVVDDYYAAGLWRGHGNRGATYLFLRWCVDQFGEELLGRLVQTNLCGVENVEAATGHSFADLYRAWSAAMFLTHSAVPVQSEEELRHLSLRGRLGEHLLAGPRYEYLRLDGPTHSFTLAGTSTQYFVAHSPVGAACRVRVTADSAAQLQVSVRQLPAGLPRLELKATAESPAADAENVPFRLELSEHNGSPLTIEHLAWERVTPGTNRESDRAGHGVVHASESIESLFGATRLDASGTLVARAFSIPRRSFDGQDVVVKVTGRDDAGRSVAAWCMLGLQPPKPQQLADKLPIEPAAR